MTLTPGQEGRAIDLLRAEIKNQLADRIPSRARMIRWFEECQIQVNGRLCPRPQTPLASRDREIKITITGWHPSMEAPIAGESSTAALAPVIYQDDHLLVLHKPSGMPSLPHSPAEFGTAVAAAAFHDPSQTRFDQDPASRLELGLLHRLDTGTSGALAFARSNTAKNFYREIWSSDRISKVYLAKVAGPAADLRPGMITLVLGADPKDSARMLVHKDAETQEAQQDDPDGFAAKSQILSVKPTGRSLGSAQELLVEIRIFTGVRHQIRATLAHLGAPILGDPVYGGLTDSRLMLHHSRLELPAFSDPSQRLIIVAPSDLTKS